MSERLVDSLKKVHIADHVCIRTARLNLALLALPPVATLVAAATAVAVATAVAAVATVVPAAVAAPWEVASVSSTSPTFVTPSYFVLTLSRHRC